MSYTVRISNGIKLYDMGTNADPYNIGKRRNQTTNKNKENSRSHTKLIQDLDFPTSCHRLKLSSDGDYLVAMGLHPPIIRCFELTQLAMKFERSLDSHGVDFQILSSDFSKMAHLCVDRSVILQTRYGTCSKIRFPHQGRDIAYLPFTADLVVVGSAPKIYRMSLTEGRFLTPLSSRSPAINSCGYSPQHGLFSCAGDDGILECFDMRARTSVGYLDVAKSIATHNKQLTVLRYDDRGLHVAVGTSSGQVILYDLRSSRPLLVRDHLYGTEIVDIKFQRSFEGGTSTPKLISSDTKMVKIWELNDGRPYTSLESPKGAGRINDVCVWPNSGLMLLALESPNILPYFIPSLGPAPKWCSSLEYLNEASVVSTDSLTCTNFDS